MNGFFVLGHYIIAKPGKGAKSILASDPIIAGGIERCVAYNFFMYGSHIGELNIYKQVIT